MIFLPIKYHETILKYCLCQCSSGRDNIDFPIIHHSLPVFIHLQKGKRVPLSCFFTHPMRTSLIRIYLWLLSILHKSGQGTGISAWTLGKWKNCRIREMLVFKKKSKLRWHGVLVQPTCLYVLLNYVK